MNFFDVPYINGNSIFIVPANASYNSEILDDNINTLKKLYQFIEVGIAGKSVLNTDIPYIKIGNGSKNVFYSASIHANEWITSIVLMKFLADYCYCYKNNLTIFDYPASELYNNCTLYIMPMVNPDGVNLVTGKISPSSSAYISAQNIASMYPSVPFTSGWKANIRGVDLNLQFPAGWQNAKKIKYSQGITSPAPRDFVGYGPLTEPEALAIYNFTLNNKFDLIIAYHTQGKEIYWQFQNFAPSQSKPIGETFSYVSGYTLADVPYNSSFAGYKDWFLQEYRKPGYTIEAGIGNNPLPISQFSQIYRDNLGILVLGTLL